MKNSKWNYRIQIESVIIAVIHILLGIMTSKYVFAFPKEGTENYQTAMTDYVLCALIAFTALYFFYSFVLKTVASNLRYNIISGTERSRVEASNGDKTDRMLESGDNASAFDKSADKCRKIFLCALPYLIVIAAVAFVKIPQGYLTNDENVIFNNAVTLTHDTWFNYLTTYYYIASLIIIPLNIGPILVKLVIEYFVVGYVVYRFKEHFRSKWANLSYLLFLMYPVIAYTTSAHRLPIYFLIYLAIFTKFAFDNLANNSGDKLEKNQSELKNQSSSDDVEKTETGQIFGLAVACAALTQWRTEGIYLALLIPLLMIIIYPNLRKFKGFAALILIMAAIQYIVSIPQNGLTSDNLDAAANDRMKPFYAYTITNMYRNGLDLQKNSDDLAIVDKYLSLDAIREINEYYGDINYEDVLILYQDGFIGTREEATVEDFINYSDAVKRIFINNPDVFIKTRIGAFNYAALPYHFVPISGENGQGGVNGLINFGINAVKTVAYNLYIPMIIIVLALFINLFKKKWVNVLVMLGLLCHWFIVFVLAPASYFKYYFPVYIMAYFYLILGCVSAILRQDKHLSGVN